jgi:hypothetical protein
VGENHVDSIKEYAQELSANDALVDTQTYLVTVPVIFPHTPEEFQDLRDQRNSKNKALGEIL